jgi:predicted XRE-type DNA-binding protein
MLRFGPYRLTLAPRLRAWCGTAAVAHDRAETQGSRRVRPWMLMRSTGELDHTEGSGNVFADLGLADPEETLAKADLARAISAAITERPLTQDQAAALLGVDPPTVSALLRGRLSGFTIDRLLRFLLALDRDVAIIIKPHARAGGRVTVVAER